jgi:glutamate synthase domain-containing protein 3
MDEADAPVLLVPEIRDYQRINIQLAQLLDAGHHRVRLVGVDGQRLLAAGLCGGWQAVISIEGTAGPELAAELDAPGVCVVCQQDTADGAGRGLRAGCLLVLGNADDALAYRQAGGSVLVVGGAGNRAGLEMVGGTLAVRGPVGRLAGDRQSGGRILLLGQPIGPHAGHGRSGGRSACDSNADCDRLSDDDRAHLASLRALLQSQHTTLAGGLGWLSVGV